MSASGSILKYGLYILIGVWMFALGVVVGRGTSPVTFDTVSFQERLKVIVGEIPKADPEKEKVDLDLEALNQPAASESIKMEAPVAEAQSPPPATEAEPKPPEPEPEPKPPEPEPEPAQPVPPEAVQIKTSRKLATLKQKPSGLSEKTAGTRSPASGALDKPGRTLAAAEKPDAKTAVSGQQYTIQVAAYRSLKDAVIQMGQMAKKGFSSYKVQGAKNGDAWYRVRTGVFNSLESAESELDRLKQARINGMIIKKDDQ